MGSGLQPPPGQLQELGGMRGVRRMMKDRPRAFTLAPQSFYTSTPWIVSCYAIYARIDLDLDRRSGPGPGSRVPRSHGGAEQELQGGADLESDEAQQCIDGSLVVDTVAVSVAEPSGSLDFAHVATRSGSK